MAAPTNAAKREESSCQPGAVHTWHKSEVSPWSLHVRCWVNTGRHLLAARISGFDPTRTSPVPSPRQSKTDVAFPPVQFPVLARSKSVCRTALPKNGKQRSQLTH